MNDIIRIWFEDDEYSHTMEIKVEGEITNITVLREDETKPYLENPSTGLFERPRIAVEWKKKE